MWAEMAVKVVEEEVVEVVDGKGNKVCGGETKGG